MYYRPSKNSTELCTVYWVFGAVERESGRCMLQVVRNRRAQTLLPLIQQWCLPVTHVMSDGWAAYQNLAQFNGGVYLHDVIVHQHNFVDPLHPDVHTQNIENLWMRAKGSSDGSSARLGPSSTRIWKSSCGRSATRTTSAA